MNALDIIYGFMESWLLRLKKMEIYLSVVLEFVWMKESCRVWSLEFRKHQLCQRRSLKSYLLGWKEEGLKIHLVFWKCTRNCTIFFFVIQQTTVCVCSATLNFHNIKWESNIHCVFLHSPVQYDWYIAWCR